MIWKNTGAIVLSKRMLNQIAAIIWQQIELWMQAIQFVLMVRS
jgi:hypothetical protein